MMKKLISVLVLIVSSGVFAQKIDSLHGGDTWGNSRTTKPGSIQAARAEEVFDLSCQDASKTQKSIPFYLFSGLLGNKGKGIDYRYDNRTQQLTVDFGPMMDACNDRIEVRPKVIGNKYFITADLVKGTFKEFKTCVFKNMKEGEPLKDPETGLYKDISRMKKVFGKVKPGYEILFASEGPFAEQKTLFGSNGSNGCLVYEKLSDEKLFAKQFDYRFIDEQEKAVKLCETGDYKRIVTNLDQFENFRFLLEEVAGKLLDKKAEQIAEKIRRSKGSPESLEAVDFDILAEFEKHTIDPLILEIEKIYSELALLEMNSDAYSKKKRELDKLKRKVDRYSKAPYPDSEVRDILLQAGYFSEEAMIYKTQSKITAARMIFNKKDGVVVDPAYAQDLLNNQIAEHNSWLDEQRKHFRIANGEITGESKKYFQIARGYEKDLRKETDSYQEGVQFLIRKAKTKCGQFGRDQRSCLITHQNLLNQFEKIYKENVENLKEAIQKYNDKGEFYASLENKHKSGVKTTQVEKTEHTADYTFDYQGALDSATFSDELSSPQFSQNQFQGQQQQQYPYPQYQQGPEQRQSYQNYSYRSYNNNQGYQQYQYPRSYSFNMRGTGAQNRGPAFNNGQGQQYPGYQYPGYQYPSYQNPQYYRSNQPWLSTPGFNGGQQSYQFRSGYYN